jgi:hypothetical protein
MKLTTTIPLDLRKIPAADREALNDILADLQASVERIQSAAARWVTLPEDTRARVVAATPPAMRDLWQRLDKVGGGTLHPQLATAAGLAARYLSRLPLEEQEHYLTQLIPVVVERGGRLLVDKMDVQRMSDFHRQQVFDAGGHTTRVRSAAEQRAWLEARSALQEADATEEEAHLAVDRPGRWRVEGDRAYIDRRKAEAGITLREALQMVRDLGG